MRNRTRFTIIAIINLTWYSIAVLVLTFLDKTVPDSLTVAWFAAWTSELALLVKLKVSDTEEKEENSLQNNEQVIESKQEGGNHD